jgi:hypothetical protein
MGGIFINYQKMLPLLLVSLAVLSVQEVTAINLQIGTDEVTISENYNLADSSTLHEETMLLEGGVVQSRQACGSDRNEFKQYVSGSDYRASNIFSVSGTFSSSTSTAAAEGAAFISQGLSADGDSIIELRGASNREEAGQFAGASDANVQSSQALFVGGAVLAGQSTAINGGAGIIESSAVSQGKNFDVSGGFSGEDGSLDARLISVASESANMFGTASVAGTECLNDEVLGYLSTGEYSMYMDGLYESRKGDIGIFGMNVVNMNINRASGVVNGQTVAQVSNSGSHPEIVTSPPGDPKSFVLIDNRRINPAKPLQLYLRTDTNLKNEKLDTTAVNQALSSAANTWDHWTQPSENNLFKSNVINDASKKAYTIDGYSVHAFMPDSNGYLAYSRTICDSNGYVIESDAVYNTKLAWTTDWAKAQAGKALDFQTIALHELGHACGLGDLYALPSSDPRRADTNEIMNSYRRPQHYLGAGDINGIETIYGA